MKKLACTILMAFTTIVVVAQQTTFRFTDGIYNTTLKTKMEHNVSALLTEINAAAGEGRKLQLNGITTTEAATRLGRMWEDFGFVCQSNAKSICYGLVNGYQARGIQVTITRQPEDCNDPKTRELTISFDKAGNIVRTAFALLNNHMSIPKGKEGGDYASKIQKKTIYTVQDKEGYLNNLAALFRNNRYIDVQFEDIMISPSNSEAMPNYYGVNLVQHWKSKNKAGKTYEDTGYLFLLWDFNEEPPVIHVRAWQPKDVPDEDIIMLDNFR